MPDVSHVRPTARRRPVVGAALAVSLLAGLGGGATQAAAATATPSGAASVDALPFDLPSPSVLRASDKEVFAHYVSWAPISLDDKPAELDYYTVNHLSPTGDGGKFAAVGGRQRDRPMPRPVRAVAGWRLLDMEEEVRQAVAAGLDGFVISMVQMGDSGGQWAANTKLLLQAAQNVDPGFSIMLRPNMISFESKTAGELAAYMAELAAYDSAHRLGDGRLVVSPYLADRWSVDKWKQFLSIMQTTHRTPVAFWPLFHNERLWSQTFDPISYGMTNWGDRNPAWNDPVPTHKDSRLGRVAAAHALGQKWMQPVSLSDARPRDGIFDEAENTTNLRNTWQIAIDSGSEAVHIPTWNDHAEGTQIQQTRKNGGAVLDLNSYYLTWYKTGVRPRIVRDSVYLTHRTQPAAALPTYPQTTLMRNRGGSPTRDTVEALTFLTAPALVTVSVGAKAYQCAADAGVDTCTVPLGTGKVSVKVVRSGATVAGTTSPHTVTSTPYVQDLDYVAVSSGRQPSDGGNGTVPTSTTLVPKKVSVTATADSYANAGAPSTNYGSSTSLASRGSTAATSYLAFDVPVAPPGTVLTGAALKLRTTTDSGAGSVDAHRVQPAGGSWTEGSLTWNNRPATTAEPIGVLPAGSVPDRTYTVPLTLDAVEKTVGTRSTLTLSSTGTDELRMTSRNHNTYTRRPQLVLTYTPTNALAADTTPPTVPGGVATAVTGSSVAVSWTASQDDVAVTGYAVHRSSTATFAPSSTTLVGRTAGSSWSETSRPAGTWYYRVVAEDAAGNSSPPSAAVAATVAAAPTTITAPTVKALAPVADTYANEGAPTRNYGTSSTLSSRGKLGSTSYLRFQIPTAPADRTLTSAVLRFRTTNDGFAGSPDVQTVRTASDSWSETELTWADRPATSSTEIGSVRALAAGTAYEVALSPAAVRALEGRSATLALTSTGTDSLWLWSSGHANAGYRPQLVLTWS